MTSKKQKEYNKKYYQEHKDEFRKRSKIWHQKHRNDLNFIRKTKEQSKKYYREHKEQVKAMAIKWQKEHPKRRRALGRKTARRLRQNLINLLGGKCSKCGFRDYRALQVDHILGGGAKELKNFKGTSFMYRYYRDHPKEAKKKLQVLCANCNWIKRFENREVSGYKE